MGGNGKRRETGSHLLVKERADKNWLLEYLMANRTDYKTDNNTEWEGKISYRRKYWQDMKYAKPDMSGKKEGLQTWLQGL